MELFTRLYGWLRRPGCFLPTSVPVNMEISSEKSLGEENEGQYFQVIENKLTPNVFKMRLYGDVSRSDNLDSLLTSSWTDATSGDRFRFMILIRYL